MTDLKGFSESIRLAVMYERLPKKKPTALFLHRYGRFDYLSFDPIWNLLPAAPG